MKHILFFLMGGLAAMMIATAGSGETSQAPALARKVGGSAQRLQDKQMQRHKGATQNQPAAELARKVGGAKTRLLSLERRRGQA